jgi:hypothetical protein
LKKDAEWLGATLAPGPDAQKNEAIVRVESMQERVEEALQVTGRIGRRLIRRSH